MRVATRMASRAAEHGIAADRCARDRWFLNRLGGARARQLNAKPFGTRGNVIAVPYFDMDVANRAS